jgi:hypothetical protein
VKVDGIALQRQDASEEEVARIGGSLERSGREAGCRQMKLSVDRRARHAQQTCVSSG